MQPVNLFDLASQQAHWLSVRQAAVAGNIANINTPAYRAVDVEPFENVLNDTSVTMRATHAAHRHAGEAQPIAVKEQEDGPMLPSGNSVMLEQELAKAGEIRRAFELNTAIVKAFHRMMMMTTRG